MSKFLLKTTRFVHRTIQASGTGRHTGIRVACGESQPTKDAQVLHNHRQVTGYLSFLASISPSSLAQGKRIIVTQNIGLAKWRNLVLI